MDWFVQFERRSADIRVCVGAITMIQTNDLKQLIYIKPIQGILSVGRARKIDFSNEIIDGMERARSK